MLGLTPPRDPFQWMLGLTPLRGPFQQILGLTPSRGPFQQVLGLTPPWGPLQRILGSYNFFRTRKNCPSIWCHHKFFQLLGDGKILPQYGILKQIFPTFRRWKNFAPVWYYLDRREFPNSSSTYPLVRSKMTAQISTGFSSQFFSLLKNLPQCGVNSFIKNSNNKLFCQPSLPWLFRFSRCWRHALGH